MRFAIEGLKADGDYSPAIRESLYARMKALQEVVDTAIQQANVPAPGNSLSKAQRVIEALSTVCLLEKEKEDEKGEKGHSQLYKDLNNLLIAALVTAKGQVFDPDTKMPTAELDTKIWSYRRLINSAPVSNPKADGETTYTENWSPTILVHPNEVLFIPVLNLLDLKELEHETIPGLEVPNQVPTGGGTDELDNAPHQFDVTNLHTHGLNVSPDWPSDDIFRQIHPWQLKFFVYKIPKDHPVGTYFYHPHHHGSVAPQVAGGMAGALIVQSDPAEIKGLDQAGVENGWTDIDQKAEGEAQIQCILLIQQLSLFQLDHTKDTNFFTRPDFFAMKDMGPWTDVNNAENPEWVKESERPELAKLAQALVPPSETYPTLKTHDPSTWVNGHFQPKLGGLKIGEIRRLRLIHAGVEENVDFHIHWVNKDGVKKEIQYQVIARDGLPLKVPQRVGTEPTQYPIVGDEGSLILSPGNRADVLISSPSDAAVGDVLEVLAGEEGQLKIATIPIIAAENAGMVKQFLTLDQATGIYTAINADRRTINVPDFPPSVGAAADFQLRFHDAISSDPAAATDSKSKFTPGIFEVDGKAFPGDQHQFQRDTTSSLSFRIYPKGEINKKDLHPFHIHVNPFLVPAATQPSDRAERLKNGLPLTEFWSDTLLVYEGASMEVRMPFLNWTGRFVGHCHILDHEDGGMMTKLRINSPPGGAPIPAMPEFMSLQEVPQSALNKLRQVSPVAGGQIPAFVKETVSLFVFMPKTPNGACPHCSQSVKALAELRKRSVGLNLRVIAITNGTGVDLPSRDAMGLLDCDLLCSDPCHDAFEAFGLIDSTPSLNADGGFEFRSAFCPGNRCLLEPTDLMHGLFISTQNGQVYSERRGFEAFDEAEQIISEAGKASLPPEKLQQSFDAVLKALPEGASKKTLEKDVKRMFERRDMFNEKMQKKK